MDPRLYLILQQALRHYRRAIDDGTARWEAGDGDPPTPAEVDTLDGALNELVLNDPFRTAALRPEDAVAGQLTPEVVAEVSRLMAEHGRTASLHPTVFRLRDNADTTPGTNYWTGPIPPVSDTSRLLEFLRYPSRHGEDGDHWHESLSAASRNGDSQPWLSFSDWCEEKGYGNWMRIAREEGRRLQALAALAAQTGVRHGTDVTPDTPTAEGDRDGPEDLEREPVDPA